MNHRVIIFVTKKRDVFLASLAHAVLAKYEPGIIVITGETGRNLAQKAVCTIMRGFRDVRGTSHAFPPHLAPLVAIISGTEKGNGFFFWMTEIWRGIYALLHTQPYPELLILECPGKRHEDAQQFLAIARPQITLVVASSDERAYKASALVDALPSNGYGIVNGDSPGARTLERYTRAHVTSFGFSERCDMRVTDFATTTEGISFMLGYSGKQALVTIDGARDKEYAYAAAAGACVGVAFGLNLPRIVDALRSFHIPNQ